MTEYTPGPWTLKHYEWRDKGKDGDFAGEIIGADGTPVYRGAASFHSINKLANARLFVAAPDMLAALEAVEWVRACTAEEYVEYCPWCKNLKHEGHAPDCERQAAIAKGRGE